MKTKLVDITPKPRTLVELFEGHPERWNQEACFLDDKRKASIKEEGVSCCLRGGLILLETHKDFYIKESLITEEVKRSVTSFNDSSTFEEVLALVKKLNL